MSVGKIQLQVKEIPEYLLYITFILLPFPNAILSIAIILLLLSSIIFGRIDNWKKVFYQNITFLPLLIIIYLFLFISLAWTDFLDLGLVSLQHRLSFLFIPLILPFYKFDIKHIRNGFILFSIVILILSLIVICHSILNLDLLRQKQYFDVHRTYMSMYVAFSSVFLLIERSKLSERKKIIPINIVLIIYALFMFIMIAKIGVISLILIYILYFKLYKKIKAYLLVMIILSSVVIINTTTEAFLAHRFTMVYKELRRTYKTLKNPNTKEIWQELGSTGHRILLYKSSLDLILNSPFYGYGIGGTKTHIKRQNWKNGFMRLGERYNYNAHNDFLQIAIEIGLFGFILLLALYLNLIIGSIRKKQMMFSYIFSIFLLNSFVESILNRQAGIIIFTLLVTLYSIVFTFEPKNKKVNLISFDK